MTEEVRNRKTAPSGSVSCRCEGVRVQVPIHWEHKAHELRDVQRCCETWQRLGHGFSKAFCLKRAALCLVLKSKSTFVLGGDAMGRRELSHTDSAPGAGFAGAVLSS